MPPKQKQKQAQAQQQVVKVQIGELPKKKQPRKRRPAKKRQPRIVGQPTIPPIVLPPQPQYTQLFPTFTPTIPQFTSMMPPTAGGVPIAEPPVPAGPMIPATEPIRIPVPKPKKKVSILKKVGKAVIKGLEIAGQQPLQKEGTTSREIQVEPMVREAEVQAVPMTRVSGIQVGEPMPIVEMPPSPRPRPRPMEITPIEEYGGGVPQAPVQIPSKTKMKEIIDKHRGKISEVGRGELSRVRKMNQQDMYNYLKGYGYL